MDKTLKQKLEILPIKIIQHPVGDTEYYKAVHVKTLIAQADKEFQELKSKIDWLNNLLDERNEEVLEKVRKMNEALPVVPECVAEYIERCKRSDCGIIWAIRPDRDANDNSEKVYDWLFPNGVKLPNGMYPNPYEPDNLVRPDKENQIKFARAWLDGYTVEKPQLFYLKNKLTRQYMYRRDKVSFGEQDYCKDSDDKPLAYCLFTKEEIDSMQTGSYEQIEVAE